MIDTDTGRTWTVAAAKARLSEVLRLAEEEGPQRIGTRKTFLVVSENVWNEHVSPRQPLGHWLVENIPRGVDIELPDRNEPDRDIPFTGLLDTCPLS